MLARFYRPIAVFLIVCIYAPTASAFQCQQTTGTCEPITDGIQPASQYCKIRNNNDGTRTMYCSYFQCDSSGNVKLHDPSDERYRPPNIFVGGGMYNIGGTVYVGGQSPVICHSNCCYSRNTTCQEFVGQINSTSSCKNLCCPTFEGYINGDCSLSCDSGLEPIEETIEEPIGDSPLFGDPGGDGKT